MVAKCQQYIIINFVDIARLLTDIIIAPLQANITDKKTPKTRVMKK